MSAVTNQNSQPILVNRDSRIIKVGSFLGCTVGTLTTLGGVMGAIDPRHANDKVLSSVAIGVGSSMMLLTIIITLVMRKRLQQENYIRI